MINVSIRFDDPSSVSNHELEKDVVKVLVEHGASATFAVIPCFEGNILRNDDLSFLNSAIKKGCIEIAQHGLLHVSCVDRNKRPSEYIDLSLDVQSESMVSGRNILNQGFDCDITGFIPPFNTFDDVTVSALDSLQYKYLSATGELGSLFPSSVSLVPATCHINDLRDAIISVRSRFNLDPTIIAVMHHYDFVDHNGDVSLMSVNDFSSLISWILKQNDVKLLTLNEMSLLHSPADWRKSIERGRRAENYYWKIREHLPKSCLIRIF